MGSEHGIYFDPKMPWIAAIVTGRFTQETSFLHQTSFGEHAHVEDSLVVDGCFVDGTVKHSILSTGAQVREGQKLSRFSYHEWSHYRSRS